MHQASNSAHYSHNVQCALDWLVGMQSRNGGSLRSTSTTLITTSTRFIRGSWRAPGSPTSDVHRRVVTVLARVGVPRTRRRSGGQSLSCARSRSGRARGSAAGHETTFTYLVVLTAFAQAGISRMTRHAPRRELAGSPAACRRRLGRRPMTATRTGIWQGENRRALRTRAPGRCWGCLRPGKPASNAVGAVLNTCCEPSRTTSLE